MISPQLKNSKVQNSQVIHKAPKINMEVAYLSINLVLSFRMDWPTFIRTGEAVQAASCRPLEQKYDLIRTVEFEVCCRKSVVINWQNSNPNYYCDLLPSHHKTSVSRRQRLNQAKNGQFISNIDFGRYGVCFCFNYSTFWQGTNQRHRLPGLHSQPLQLRH